MNWNRHWSLENSLALTSRRLSSEIRIQEQSAKLTHKDLKQWQTLTKEAIYTLSIPSTALSCWGEVFLCVSEFDRLKGRNSLSCIYRLEIDLHCGTCSTEDALLHEVAEAVQEDWHRPCAHCGGIHPVRSVWFPLAAHCPSGFKEKCTLILSVLHLFLSRFYYKHKFISAKAPCGLLGIWYYMSPLIKSDVKVSEDKQMSDRCQKLVFLKRVHQKNGACPHSICLKGAAKGLIP